MFEFVRANFYWIDFAIGAAIPILVLYLYRTGRIDRYVWWLFWLGCALGVCWELPMSLLNEFSSAFPVAHFIQPLPTHFSVLVIMHSFWDGGLFLVGVWFVRAVCKPPWFDQFRPCELFVLLVWGQLSELIVELLSTFNEAWAYIPYCWNPTLFMFNDSHITLLPQMIWLAAPIVFYLLALKMKRSIARTG